MVISCWYATNASADWLHYLFLSSSEMTRLLFHVHDDAVLKYLNDDGTKIEPEWLVTSLIPLSPHSPLISLTVKAVLKEQYCACAVLLFSAYIPHG